MAKRKNTEIHPIPAVFHRADSPADTRDKPWTFEPADGTGATSLRERIMSIPVDDSPESAGIRAHEMLHAALSPYVTGPMDMETLAAEDGRVETLATQAGIVRPMATTPEKTREILSGLSGENLAMAAIAVTGSPQEEVARAWLTANGHGDITDLMDWARTQYQAGKGMEATKAVAERLRRRVGSGPRKGTPAPLLAHIPPLPAHIPPPPPPKQLDTPPLPEPAPEAPRMTLPVHADEYIPPPVEHTDRASWAKMAIETPPLPVIVSNVHGGKRTRSTDYGTVPRNLWRAGIDGKVFSSRRHRRQGTVLIDASGSMPLSASDIEQFTREAPAAVVAIYWGRFFEPTGTLRVVADNGRMGESSAFERDDSANAIDGPALWWLSKQRGPRVWVSDGGITGSKDGGVTPEMQKEVDAVLRRSRIRTIEPLPDWPVTVAKALY